MRVKFEPRLADSLEGTNSSVDLQPEYPLPLLVITLFNQNSRARSRWGHNLIAMEVSVCSSEVTGIFQLPRSPFVSRLPFFKGSSVTSSPDSVTDLMSWCFVLFFFFCFRWDKRLQREPFCHGKVGVEGAALPLADEGRYNGQFYQN